jgi:hypothetical protein
MLSIASTPFVVSDFTLTISPGCNIILLPAIISTDDPEGNGIDLATYTSSAFSPEEEAVTI